MITTIIIITMIVVFSYHHYYYCGIIVYFSFSSTSLSFTFPFLVIPHLSLSISPFLSHTFYKLRAFSPLPFSPSHYLSPSLLPHSSYSPHIFFPLSTVGGGGVIPSRPSHNGDQRKIKNPRMH